MHLAHTTFVFLPSAIQLPMHKRCCSPALIKIPPNSLSFLSPGLQVTGKQQCFMWPTELACASSWLTHSECKCLPPGQQAHSKPTFTAPYILQAAHVHQLAACSGDVCLSNGQLLSQEVHEVSEATNHSKHMPSEPKGGKRQGSHFPLLPFYSRILYWAPFKDSSYLQYN